MEVIGLNDESSMYLNEEGKLERLPVNHTANRLFARGTLQSTPGDFLVGPVVVLGVLNDLGRNDGEEHDVPASVLELCEQAGIEVVDRTV